MNRDLIHLRWDKDVYILLNNIKTDGLLDEEQVMDLKDFQQFMLEENGKKILYLSKQISHAKFKLRSLLRVKLELLENNCGVECIDLVNEGYILIDEVDRYAVNVFNAIRPYMEGDSDKIHVMMVYLEGIYQNLTKDTGDNIYHQVYNFSSEADKKIINIKIDMEIFHDLWLRC